MKKFDFKSLVLGVAIGTISVSTVFAVNILRTADFNDTRIFFNGKQIDISNQPMISVYKDGEVNPRNYMPVRAILEGMGYGVAWGANATGDYVSVVSKDYLETAEDWVNFEDVQTIIDCDPRAAHRIYYDTERHVARANFDVKYNWDLPTAIIQDSIYVEKAGVDHILDLVGLPTFDEYTPEFLAELKQEASGIVSFADVYNLLLQQPGVTVYGEGMEDKLQLAYDQADNNYKVTFDSAQLGVIERVKWEKDSGEYYMRKEDINHYLEKYNLAVIP